MSPTTAPVKNATYKANIVFRKPKKSPIKKTSFTSPNPTPLPLVIEYKSRNNKNAPNAENKLASIKYFVSSIMYVKETTIAENKTLSGIIPYFKSVKKITIKEEIINK